jgi:ribonuclease HII
MDKTHLKKILSKKKIKSSFWKVEKNLIRRHKNLVAIDEAGRGALAGPLTLGALYLDKTSLKILEKNKIFFFDSKILKPEEREIFKKIIKKIGLKYKIFSLSNKKIDKMGMSKAFLYGIKKIHQYFEPNCVVLDGKPIRGLNGSNNLPGLKPDKSKNSPGLRPDKLPGFIPNISSDYPGKLSGKHPGNNNPRKSAFYFFIKGDQRLCSLGGASILAKTHRDSYMKKMSKKFPEYLFDIHKGYGTKKHYSMIKKYGPCPLHRKTFLKSLISF